MKIIFFSLLLTTTLNIRAQVEVELYNLSRYIFCFSQKSSLDNYIKVSNKLDNLNLINKKYLVDVIDSMLVDKYISETTTYNDSSALFQTFSLIEYYEEFENCPDSLRYKLKKIKNRIVQNKHLRNKEKNILRKSLFFYYTRNENIGNWNKFGGLWATDTISFFLGGKDLINEADSLFKKETPFYSSDSSNLTNELGLFRNNRLFLGIIRGDLRICCYELNIDMKKYKEYFDEFNSKLIELGYDADSKLVKQLRTLNEKILNGETIYKFCRIGP